MNQQQRIRVRNINQIKSILNKIKIKNKKFDRREFIFQIMSVFNCSKRTAQEYLETAENGTETNQEILKEFNF